jgi:hypothetical protein
MVAEAVDRAAAGPQGELWTAKIRRQTVAYALWRHHRNLAAYVQVMGGSR